MSLQIVARLPHEIHLGDVGTVFQLLVVHRTLSGETVLFTQGGIDYTATDLSAANTMEAYFVAPDKTVDTHTLGFTSDGTDGYADFTSVAATFDQLGAWEYQGHFVDTGVYDFVTSIGEFVVERDVSA